MIISEIVVRIDGVCINTYIETARHQVPGIKSNFATDPSEVAGNGKAKIFDLELNRRLLVYRSELADGSLGCKK